MIIYTNRTKIPFQIDECDFEKVSAQSWRIGSKGYPETDVVTIENDLRKSRVKRLHLFILGRAPIGLQWDHRNRDKLDNRRENLRAVTPLINYRNRGVRADNKSGIRGVTWDSKNNLWLTEIVDKGERIFLGRFASLEEAKLVRKEAENVFWRSEQ